MALVTLDFNAASYTLFAGESTDIAFTGLLVEDGFTLDNLATSNSTHEFATIRAGGHNDHDSNDDVPLSTFASTNVQVTKDDGRTFDLISMQFDTFDAGSSATMTITGTKADLSTVQFVFATDTILSLETVTLPETFRDLTKVVFSSASTNVQFNDIVLRTYFFGTEGVDNVFSGVAAEAVKLLGGNDTITFSGNFDNGDIVDGGAGTDTLVLNGAQTITLGSGLTVQNVTNVEILKLQGGTFNVTTADIFVAGGQTLTIDATTLTAAQTLTFNGAAETNGNFVINGGSAADNLTGGSGNDTFVGNGGADTMTGGLGNDVFFVNDSSDAVIEISGQGSDRVSASSSYALAASAEVETLETFSVSGTSAINLTGNGFIQAITGNNGNNVLDGGGGNDTLAGAGGNDTLIGSAGSDNMFGGLGDDVYFVDSASDFIGEAAAEGNDRVATAVSYTLSAGASVEIFETVALSSSAAFNLTGNALTQYVIGNDGNNVLQSGGGNDWLIGAGGDDTIIGSSSASTMEGGLGNDVYFVIDSSDFIYESSGGGADRVAAGTSYTLGAAAEVEQLEAISLSDTTPLNFTGNVFQNTLIGNNGNNTLDGKGGADVLVGVGGNDTFAFTTPLGGSNIDRIDGFTTAADKIALDDAIFAGLSPGALPATAFVIGSQALDGDDRIIYNSATGALLFDADGSGGGAAIQFATLSGSPAIVASDFTVI